MKWPVVKIGDLIEQIRGVTYSSGDAIETYKDGYVELLRANNISNDGVILFDDVTYVPSNKVSDKQLLRNNDILIAASSGSIGIVGKAASFNADRVATFGAFCKVLRPSAKVDARYLANYFQTSGYRKRISFLAAGANINNLRNEHIDNLDIVLPPLAEQKRIAELLDTADRIMRLREHAIAKLDGLEQSFFVHMFGNKNSIKLKEACKFVSGGTPNKDEAKYWNGSYPWISSADIDGEQIKSFRHFVTDEALTKSSTNIVPKNSILVVTRTGVGKVIVCDQSMCFSQDITGLLIKDNFDPHFIAAAIRNKKNEIVSQARGATIKGVTRDVIENIDVPIASLEDQYLFAKKIHQIHKQLTVQKKCKAHLTLMQNSLQHQSFAVN